MFWFYANTCGASLVAPNVLLLAAHCSPVELITLNKVRINGVEGRQARETFRVIEELAHEMYKPDGSYEYDFKLICINGFSSNRLVQLVDESTKEVEIL